MAGLSCQTQILNIDSASSNIGVYSLNTVGVSGSLSVEGSVVIQASSVQNGKSNVCSLHKFARAYDLTSFADGLGLDFKLNGSWLTLATSIA